MAAASACSLCIGIEKAEVPVRYSESMDFNFKFWMKWYGKTFGEYKLIKGDFLVDDIRETITSASLVFVNNFAFGPNVDHRLKERFADMKDGAKIVSSKSFCPLNFRITERNLSDIGTIMHVREITPMKGSVSWTGKPVSYYVHIIDRVKLANYFQKKNPKLKDDDSSLSLRSRKSKNSPSAIYNMDSSSNDSKELREEGPVYGPTTRKAWSEWCNSRSKTNTGNSNTSEQDSNDENEPIKLKIRTTRRPRKRQLLEQKRRPGRPKKNKVRSKRVPKSLNLNGLDLLHAQTILSTSSAATAARSEPAPGCIDQKLDCLGSLDSSESSEVSGTPNTGRSSLQYSPDDNRLDEAFVPPANFYAISHPSTSFLPKVVPNITTLPPEVNVALDALLNNYKQQFLQFFGHMQSPQYKREIEDNIRKEREKSEKLRSRSSQLDKQIKLLVEDSVGLLKNRMGELGVQATSPTNLLSKAKEIVFCHKELQAKANNLQHHVSSLEEEQAKLLAVKQIAQSKKEIKMNGVIHSSLNNRTKHTPEALVEEIWMNLNHKKKLNSKIHKLQSEVQMLEKVMIAKHKNLSVSSSLPKLNGMEPDDGILPVTRVKIKKIHHQRPVEKQEPSITMPNFEDRLRTMIKKALKEGGPPKLEMSSHNPVIMNPTVSMLSEGNKIPKVEWACTVASTPPAPVLSPETSLPEVSSTSGMNTHLEERNVRDIQQNLSSSRLSPILPKSEPNIIVSNLEVEQLEPVSSNIGSRSLSPPIIASSTVQKKYAKKNSTIQPCVTSTTCCDTRFPDESRLRCSPSDVDSVAAGSYSPISPSRTPPLHVAEIQPPLESRPNSLVNLVELTGGTKVSLSDISDNGRELIKNHCVDSTQNKNNSRVEKKPSTPKKLEDISEIVSSIPITQTQSSSRKNEVSSLLRPGKMDNSMRPTVLVKRIETVGKTIPSDSKPPKSSKSMPKLPIVKEERLEPSNKPKELNVESVIEKPAAAKIKRKRSGSSDASCSPLKRSVVSEEIIPVKNIAESVSPSTAYIARDIKQETEILAVDRLQTVKTDTYKPLDTNRRVNEKTSVASTRHDTPARRIPTESNNRHWQAKISSGFDKLMALASNQIETPKKARQEVAVSEHRIPSVSPRGPPKKDKMWKIKLGNEELENQRNVSALSSHSALLPNSESLTHGKTSKVETLPYHAISNTTKEPSNHHLSNKKLVTNRHTLSPVKKSEKHPRKGPRTPPDTPPRTPSISPERPPTPHTPVSVYSHHQSPLSSISSVGYHRTPSPANYCPTPEYSGNLVIGTRLPLTLSSRSRSPSPFSSRASSTDSRSESLSARSLYGQPNNKIKADNLAARHHQDSSKNLAKYKSVSDGKLTRKLTGKKMDHEEVRPSQKEATIMGQPLPANFPQAEQPRMTLPSQPLTIQQTPPQQVIQTQVPIQQTALGTLQVQSQVPGALPTYVSNPMANYPGQPLGNILIHNQNQHSIQGPPQMPIAHQVPAQHQVMMQQHSIPIQHQVIMTQQQPQQPQMSIMHQPMQTHQVVSTQPPLPPVPPPVPPPPPMMGPSASNSMHLPSRGNYSNHPMKMPSSNNQPNQIPSSNNGSGSSMMPMMVNFSVPPPNYNMPPSNPNLQLPPPGPAPTQPGIANMSVPPPPPGHVSGGIGHPNVQPSGCNFSLPPPPMNHHQPTPQALLPPPVDMHQNAPPPPPPNMPIQRTMMSRPPAGHHSQPQMHPPLPSSHHHSHIQNNQYQSHHHHGSQHSRLQPPPSHPLQMQTNYDRMNNHYSLHMVPKGDPMDGRMGSNNGQRMDYRMMNGPRSHRQYDPHMAGRNRHYHQK